MCYCSSWDSETNDMTKEMIDTLYEQIKDVELESIVFAGIGEPSFSKNFLYATQKFKDFKLEITSNGLVSPGKTDILCNYFDKIIISVDGIDEDYYKMRNASFENLLSTLRIIKDYKYKNNTKVPNVEFAFVLTKSNKDTLFDFVNLARDYNADKILVSHLLPGNEEQVKDIFYTRYENKEGKDFAHKINNYSYYGNRIIMSLPYMEIKTDRVCPFIDKEYTYIDYLGNVIPCYRYSNEYDEYVFGRKKRVLKHSFGNISKDTLKNVYNSNEYQNFRTSVELNKFPSCVDCDLQDGCSFIDTTECDCLSYEPTCGDCLWNRNIIRCT
ncbi:SPASM domain-containing protein [Mycoplasmatota bacterium]|nr:SPASM domain-containing protein [Mycoplasmatota bacterium]